jgi:2-polyprenyl-6-hydroxyphenyl methylase / 3-demethylubiquinone-9 3-methyltransferase
MSSSVAREEVEKFSKDAPRWWDENGPFAPLHRLNPARLAYIREQICKHYELDTTSLKALDGLKIVDIGCGGGLVCEPVARMGAIVTGLDADPVAIETAKAHATSSALSITYENKAAEDTKTTFDVVLALEIIEHVKDPVEFVESCAKLVKPGGMLIFSTLNRTPKAFALGIVAAEYILRWLPRGTHDWKKFVKPSELTKYIRNCYLQPVDISGLIYNPLKNDFEISKTDINVNYLLTVVKP